MQAIRSRFISVPGDGIRFYRLAEKYQDPFTVISPEAHSFGANVCRNPLRPVRIDRTAIRL